MDQITKRQFYFELLTECFTEIGFKTFVFTHFPKIASSMGEQVREKVIMAIIEYCEVHNIILNEIIEAERDVAEAKIKEIKRRYGLIPSALVQSAQRSQADEIFLTKRPQETEAISPFPTKELPLTNEDSSTLRRCFIIIKPGRKVQITFNLPADASIQRTEIKLTEGERMFYNERLHMAKAKPHDKRYIAQSHVRLQKEGQNLYQMVFAEVGDEWENSVVNEGGYYLLNLESLIWDLPWEILFRPRLGFLDQGAYEPIIREIDTNPSSAKKPYIDVPKICFIAANPLDNPTLAKEQLIKVSEKLPEDISQKIVHSVEAKLVEHVPFWERICQKLRQVQPNILHIVAHGTDADGFIIEDRGRDQEVIIGYHALAEILFELKSVRLLVIAACESNLFFVNYPDVARKLFSNSNLLAAVLMGSEISGKALIEFTDNFYSALWKGYEVAAAIGIARSALRYRKSDPLSLQWSVPIMYKARDIDVFFEGLQSHVDKSALSKDDVERLRKSAKAIQNNVEKLYSIHQNTVPMESEIGYLARQLRASVNNFNHELSLIEKLSYDLRSRQWLSDVASVISRSERDILRFANSSINGLNNSELAIIARGAFHGTYALMAEFDCFLI